MTNDEREKHIRIANMLIGVINDVNTPMLMYQMEKDVAKETLENYIKMLESQSCEDCISREYLIDKIGSVDGLEGVENSNFFAKYYMDIVKSAPSVTPKTSCEACREQLLKHLEKEDWVDTVNCVMNMPFINKPCISEGVCREDKIQVLDKIRAEIIQMPTISSNANDIYKADALAIIDKYKSESEE